jgi:hypothetical protein
VLCLATSRSVETVAKKYLGCCFQELPKKQISVTGDRNSGPVLFPLVFRLPPGYVAEPCPVVDVELPKLAGYAMLLRRKNDPVSVL